ncbi:hypothetical protein Tco_0770066 [Tanacetum coccineum]|uniref:Uncharacterized protein n=1 Tax=Tanacetum coccineum TaxID=301880 RepID=A0ABQ4ZEH5_9ASTR
MWGGRVDGGGGGAGWAGVGEEGGVSGVVGTVWVGRKGCGGPGWGGSGRRGGGGSGGRGGEWNLHEVNAKTRLEVLHTQFKKVFSSKGVNSSDYVYHLWQEDFKDYTGCQPETYKSDLLKYPDTLDKFIDNRVLKYGELRMKENEINSGQAVDANLVVTESSRIESENNSSENALSKSVNETQSRASNGPAESAIGLAIFVITFRVRGTIAVESINSIQVVGQSQTSSSRLRNDTTHAVDADIRPVNDQEPFAEGQHGQILNETSNKAKIKMEKDAFETINIELEHSVVKLLATNEQLNKENEHLKQTYKDLYDSIKKTRV